MPGLFDVLRLCAARGWRRIVVTSQQGVGKGLMSAADLDAVHAWMQAELRRHEAPVFDGIYVCPHLDGTCTCRKPSPELILTAARDHSLDLPRSILIGDRDRDILMARNAGVGFTIRLTGSAPELVPADSRAASLEEAAAIMARVMAPVPGAAL